MKLHDSFSLVASLCESPFFLTHSLVNSLTNRMSRHRGLIPRITFSSLDIEGAEFEVLKTIPWDKVDIQVCYSECKPSEPDCSSRLVGRSIIIN